MGRPLQWLALGIGVSAVAVAAVVLLPRDEPAPRDFAHLTSDLCIVAPATPYDPASGLAMLEARPVPADARCPVCGMYPARYPRWAAQTLFKDGAAHFFDSPLDLFAFLQKVDRHERRYTLDDVAVSYVSDFESGQWIEARHAFFVLGSSVVGPMRDADLPAFGSRKSAEALTRSHGGKVLTAAEITPELTRSLSRNLHHRH
jgi:nitrous oxide reductase accessory protein NosL